MDGMPEVDSAFRRDRDGKALVLCDRAQTQLPVARFEQYGLMQFDGGSASDQFPQSTQCFGQLFSGNLHAQFLLYGYRLFLFKHSRTIRTTPLPIKI